MSELEKYFQLYRKDIIGNDLLIPVLNGYQRMIYADWAASGRLYRKIENYITEDIGPYFANTHTETTYTGRKMTMAYHNAIEIIKKHVGANEQDLMFFSGYGMTSVVNKLQRLLGLKVPEKYRKAILLTMANRPLVIVTHMEHHSNQTSWIECLCDVKILRREKNGIPDMNHLRDILEKNRNRRLIIGSFTACSNVTGIITPYYKMAEILHEFDRFCFVDFAGSAPYVEINMHPEKEEQRLDAVMFSPHKFLGGPGSPGVLILNKELYKNKIPDHPGGGTVLWTNPWGEHRYFDNIEIREDGGTPGILQGIKAALAVKLKEEMTTSKMMSREHELTGRLMNGLKKINGIEILEAEQMNRIGFVSFYHETIHYNMIVKLLNDRYGIQTRGGCVCAGTYGHILLNIDYDKSHQITDKINSGDIGIKPGWVRISLHPTMKNGEIDFIIGAIEEIILNYSKCSKGYSFNSATGEFFREGDIFPKVDLEEALIRKVC